MVNVAVLDVLSGINIVNALMPPTVHSTEVCKGTAFALTRVLQHHSTEVCKGTAFALTSFIYRDPFQVSHVVYFTWATSDDWVYKKNKKKIVFKFLQLD